MPALQLTEIERLALIDALRCSLRFSEVMEARTAIALETRILERLEALGIQPETPHKRVVLDSSLER